MNVKELRELLKDYDDHAHVMVYNNGDHRGVSTFDTFDYNQTGKAAYAVYLVLDEE